jgi:NTE family protein
MPDLNEAHEAELSSPVHRIPTDPETPTLREGIALCLSGGGYRAMLFHAGALWRLNEAGYLPRLKRISSVSGGSITAGVLGHRWSQLAFDGSGVATAFENEVVAPVRRLAGKTVDEAAVVGGVLLPGTVGDRVVKAYDRYLFEGATLQDLPEDSGGKAPRFVINATNVQSGVLWRFSRPYMADYRVGMIRSPKLPLASHALPDCARPRSPRLRGELRHRPDRQRVSRRGLPH